MFSKIEDSEDSTVNFVKCSKCGATLSIYVANPIMSEYYCDRCCSNKVAGSLLNIYPGK